MGSLKGLGEGFLVATGIVWSFNIASLFRSGDAGLATLYLMILAIPVSTLLLFGLRKKKSEAHFESANKWREMMFSVQGAALAFWCFDIITTFYAINVTGLAYELNPLGWPLGILGGFAYYGPALVFSYVLLFRFKEKIALYAAVPLSMVTVAMGAMNLVAGAQNFQVFVETAALTTGIRFGLLTVVGTVCLMVPLALKRTMSQPKSKPLLP